MLLKLKNLVLAIRAVTEARVLSCTEVSKMKKKTLQRRKLTFLHVPQSF